MSTVQVFVENGEPPIADTVAVGVTSRYAVQPGVFRGYANYGDACD